MITAADIPPGSAIRNSGWVQQYWSQVLTCDMFGVSINGCADTITYEALLATWQIKRPGENWRSFADIEASKARPAQDPGIMEADQPSTPGWV